MASDQELAILIRAQNITQQAFDQARKDLASVGQESQKTNQLLGSLKNGLGALGIAFSAQAVIGFAKSVFDSASEIHDLSEQLGISAEAVQGFKFAAEQSGSSLEAVGIAITKMNKNLATGDSSTIQALESVGLKFDDIRNMKPEDAFLAITDAIQKIPDPMKQVEVGTALMGKGFAELLPGIKEGFRAAADGANKMSNDTIDSLEAAQDAWGKLSNAVTIASGEIIAASISVGKEVTSSWQSAAQFALNWMTFGAGAAATMADLSQVTKKTAADINLSLPPAVHKTKEELDAAEKAAKKHAEALEEIRLAQIPLTESQKAGIKVLIDQGQEIGNIAEKYGVSKTAVSNYSDALKRNEDTAKDWIKLHQDMAAIAHKLTVDGIDQLRKAAQDEAHVKTDLQNQMLADLVKFHEKNQRERLSDSDAAVLAVRQEADKILRIYRDQFGASSELFAQLSAEVEEDAKNQFQAIAQASAEAAAAMNDDAHGVHETWMKVLQSIPQLVVSAFTGGGGIGGAIQGIGSLIGSTIGKGIGASFKALGALGGPLGEAIGSLVGPLISSLGKLLGIGPTEYEKRMRAAAAETKNLQQQLVSAHGSMQQLIIDADLVGINIKEAFKWQDPEAFKKIVGEIDQKTQLLNAAMQEYGFTWEDLGDKARGAKLGQLFDDLFAKTDILRTAGIDYHTILERQAGDYSKLVQAAIRTGTEIPIAMQPVLQDMIDLGLLTDENGNKLTDLTDIKWAKSMTEGFQDVTNAIHELTDALVHGVGGALDDIGKRVVHPRIEPVYGDSGSGEDASAAAAGGIVGPSRVIPFRHGGFVPRGTDTVPAMLTPGELVLNAAQQKRIAAALSGADGDIHITLDMGDLGKQMVTIARKDAARGGLRARVSSGRSY
jgi:predicted transcriptional regulator